MHASLALAEALLSVGWFFGPRASMSLRPDGRRFLDTFELAMPGPVLGDTNTQKVYSTDSSGGSSSIPSSQNTSLEPVVRHSPWSPSPSLPQLRSFA